MNKKVKIVIYVFAAIVLGLGIYMYFSNTTSEKKLEINKNVRPLINFSDFYNVSKCIDKYIFYKNQQDEDALIDTLSVKYQQEENINQNNVIEKLSINSSKNIFKTKEILYAQYEENKYIYYVRGLEGEDNSTMDSELNEKLLDESYYIVYVDFKELSFSIRPYDGKIFNDGEK